MRINHPVTATEYAFPAGETLVSTTDLQSHITYCNPAFVQVSGYEKAELIGQPHNLIRHPDMPAEAFRDMWATIAGGQPWSAPVKNRRKDGSFYWVMANVTPILRNGQPVGYMSVRTQPSREEVAAAEALYRTMRDEAAAGRLVHRLDGGMLRIDTGRGKLGRLLRAGPRGRMMLTLAATCGASAVLVGLVSPTGVFALLGEALGGAALGAAVGAWLARRQSAPIETLVRTANRMAAGDLTQRIATGREDSVGRLARALSQLNVNLRSIVGDARSQVERMRDATSEIAHGNTDLSSRTESQASSLQQTASSMEEITSTVRNGAESASQASKLAVRASEVTQAGSRAMEDVSRTMSVISESSHRIAEIIGTIDAIAFQTNILALNAAVEAARAGEQGRGFAVVAAEVRALAQRTSGAAREIKQLIGESTEKVDTGNRLAAEAQKTIEGALDTVRQVSRVIESISAGASEQLSGISQVNEAVAQMDSMTQQNAALVEQIAASAVQLREQASNVVEAVQVFTLDAKAAQAA
ncbi:MAG TPA: methyl-accepting chemotaxis protein [Methylibium sp.]|uniref:methyl-accepting chemotaxis protein n=1 Tax=Methylibium sp. TaxID=2067992 RepID=UPI002DB65C3E|nr:methyl-accepting chemotaxis protein [Methylibium sp.]HEU4458599.1 methyl-accepting chemotaxis protein [Methylibium sp.]